MVLILRDPTSCPSILLISEGRILRWKTRTTQHISSNSIAAPVFSTHFYSPLLLRTRKVNVLARAKSPVLQNKLTSGDLRKQYDAESPSSSESDDEYAPFSTLTDGYMSQSDTFSRYSGYLFDKGSFSSDAETWREYEREEMESYFLCRPFLLARRFSQISTLFGGWLARRYADGKLGKSEEMFKQRAAELREILVQLGPAFVKIAQAVSSRPDVVPPAFLSELSLLQDRIAPFSTVDAIEIIEEELQRSVSEIFSEISPHPVAAASLGQVYQARLASTGELVAVKVQRPGVRAAIALDIFLIRTIAGAARKVARLNTDLQALVDDWATSLFKEMNYEQECINGTRFKNLYGHLPKVLVPKMYSELTRQKVLVMEWVEGKRLSEVRDLGLVEVGVYCSLTQILDSGFYHADPHPGNLLKTKDGKLAYLDFGMMGDMKQNLREALIQSCVHLVNREFDDLARDFVQLGFIPSGQDMEEVAYALTGVFQEAIQGGVRNISFGNLSVNLGRTMYRFKFNLPSYFSLVVRSLTVLEGIALSSNPNYKVLGNAYPWIARKVLTDDSQELRSTLSTLLYKNGSFRVDRLESLLEESTRPMFSDRSPSRSKSKKEDDREEERELEKREATRRVLAFALSEEGGFVRQIIIDEVAKGFDSLNRVAYDSSLSFLLSSLPRAFQTTSLVRILPSRISEDEDYEHLSNLKRLTRLLLNRIKGGATDSPSSTSAPTPPPRSYAEFSKSRERWNGETRLQPIHQALSLEDLRTVVVEELLPLITSPSSAGRVSSSIALFTETNFSFLAELGGTPVEL